MPLLAGAAVSAIVAGAIPDALIGVFYDDGIYAALARSLAEGGGYRLPYLPGRPEAVHYPPGYPAFLAGLWLLWPRFPENAVLLRGANAVLMGLFAALATGYLTPRVPLRPWLTALALVLGATAIPMIAVSTVLFSEPLFLVLAVLALWTADRARLAPARPAVLLAVLAGLIAGLATLTRSIGIALVVAAVVPLLLARRPLAAISAALPAIILVLPWNVWSARHAAATDALIVSNYGTYGQFMAQAGASWLSPAALLELVRPLVAITVPIAHPAAAIVLGALLVAAIVAGLAALWHTARALVVFLAVYAAVVTTWPYGPDRFIWGILPWLAVAFACGVRAAWIRAGTAGPVPALRIAVALSAVLLGAGFARAQIGGWRRGGATAAQRDISAAFREVLPWVRERTDSSAVIAGEDEALIWLYTGRRAVPSYLWRVRGRGAESFGPDSLRAWLDRSGATHLVLTGPGSDAAPTVDALIGRFPGYLRVVRAWPGPMLAFEVQRGG